MWCRLRHHMTSLPCFDAVDSCLIQGVAVKVIKDLQ